MTPNLPKDWGKVELTPKQEAWGKQFSASPDEAKRRVKYWQQCEVCGLRQESRNNFCPCCGNNLTIKSERRASSELAPASGWTDWRKPVPELKDSFPVVLYFGNDDDRQEFIDTVKAEKPNLVARRLPESPSIQQMPVKR